MKKTATTKRSAPRSRALPEPLGPGLHLVVVEPASGESLRVRALDGRRLVAALAREVHPDLVRECRRDARPMIACDTPRGPTVVGALQTTPSLAREPDGTLVLEGPRVRVRGEKGVVIEAGEAVRLALSAPGAARLEGDRMVIDMSSNVRVLSALVELP